MLAGSLEEVTATEETEVELDGVVDSNPEPVVEAPLVAWPPFAPEVVAIAALASTVSPEVADSNAVRIRPESTVQLSHTARFIIEVRAGVTRHARHTFIQVICTDGATETSEKVGALLAIGNCRAIRCAII